MSASSIPEPVWIHASRRMEALIEQRRQALFNQAVPNAFHYDGWRQTQLWLEVAQMYQPPGMEPFYRGAFTALRGNGQLRSPLHVIGLGAGGARKERCLLEALGDPANARFTPVDVSHNLALQSAHCVQDLASGPIRPLVADVEAFPGLPTWLNETDQGTLRRWFTAFGLTPNSEPPVLLPRLREFLREQDRLLISANLLPDGRMQSIRPEYDNPETRRWLRQVLVDWGLDALLDRIQFSSVPVGEEQALIASVRWKKDQAFLWEGAPFQAARGTPLRLFFTLRFTMESFRNALNKYGFSVDQEWESPCGREGVFLAHRSNCLGETPDCPQSCDSIQPWN